MLKTKVNYKLSASIVVFFAFLLMGASCTKQKQQEEVVAPKNNPTEKPVVKEVFKPLKLVYELKNFGPTGPSGKLSMTIWVEGKEMCAGREAYIGLIKMDRGEQNAVSEFSKITIFSDNGEVAISKFGNEDKLAFDDMQAEYNQLNVYLTLNSVFANAGKNFNSPEVWSATSPILLKNVDSGMSLSDYSIIRQEEQTIGVLPCQKFKIVAKGTNMEGVINACIAKEVNNVKLPFVVSFAYGNSSQGGPSWLLKSYSEEKSGIISVPQCLEPVKCTYVKEPAQAERSSCAAKDGQLEQQRTAKGCVAEYKCFTQEDIVVEAMSRMQNPNCLVNQEVKNKMIACRKSNKPNYDISNYDGNGCALDVVCRK